MPLQGSFRAALAIGLIALAASAGDARAQEVFPRGIDANVNDPGILTTRGQNLVWLPDAARRVDKLLVFLPSGGANNLPTEFLSVGAEGRRLGYHTIVLAYRNEVGINAAPPLGCGAGVEASSAPPNCAINARSELLDGRGESTVVDVDRANSIENRLSKVLQHLATSYASEGWAQFRDASTGEPRWSEAVVAGQSLGAGQATLIGMRYPVRRVALFSGWTDAKHGWTKLEVTPSERYFAQIHQRENFFDRTCFTHLALGLTAACPLVGFTTIDAAQPPFNTRLLVFNLEPDSTPPAVVADPFHSSSSRDGWIAKEPDGITPSQKLLNSWRSILGDSDADTWLDQRDNCVAVANAEQIDSDRNGVGDACGPTFAAGTVAGSVPATLSLTLGVAAAFPAFTPGVDRSYDASTTANVISSAGDAALSVHDASANAPGRLVNGAFSLSEPLQASATGTFAALSASPLTLLTYAGPVSNGSVTLAFRQHIGPTQALRTGAYSKTLTFTLSTTMP